MKLKKSPFVSLFWKASACLVIIFLLLISIFTYINTQQLRDMQAHQRALEHQQFIIEYNGLLNSTGFMLSNLIDSLPSLTAEQSNIYSRIDTHWMTLQITWGLESAIIHDEKGAFIKQWGDKQIQADKKTLQRTIATRAPVKEVVCQIRCHLVVSSPLLDENGEIYIVQLSVSLIDTMLDFQNITGSNIGFLTPSRELDDSAMSMGNTGLSISSLTSHETLLPIVRRFASDQLQPGFMGEQAQRFFTIDTLRAQYEIMFLAPPELEKNEALVMFVSNTTTSRSQIQNARRTYIITGIVAAIISLALAFFVIWRPIRSIQRQAKALPLLPQGKYDEARARLFQMTGPRLFDDEISHLQRTSIKVTNQLEGFNKKIEQHSQKLYDMAHFDPLTGLINRTYLTELVEEKLNQYRQSDSQFALLYLDLDNFKHINDALGHKLGDRLLKVVAKRLKGCVHENCSVARLGGDEFSIILDAVETQTQAAEVAKVVLKALLEPVVIDNRNLSISTSIGITMAPRDGKSFSQLLQNADLAMYEAKSAGKNNYHFFDDQLHKDADTRIALEEELRRAVKNQEFVLYYQPQINLRTGELIGCEALIRWNHPDRGILSPFFFIDAIESNGLIIPVGKWIIREACRQCGEWRKRGLEDIHISINLSTRQFSDPDLIHDIQQGIEANEIRPGQIEFEVTESLLATDINHAISLLKGLQALGVSIAIDDFGTGYSSLSYLKKLPLNKLKVDRAFVQDLPKDQDDKQITTAIVAMAHSLKLNVVAEGVETSEQQDFLKAIACEYGQGFYFAKPMSARDFYASRLVQRALKKTARG